MKKIKIECLAVFPVELPPRKYPKNWGIEGVLHVRGMSKYKVWRIFEDTDSATKGLAELQDWAESLNGRFTI